MTTVRSRHPTAPSGSRQTALGHRTPPAFHPSFTYSIFLHGASVARWFCLRLSKVEILYYAQRQLTTARHYVRTHQFICITWEAFFTCLKCRSDRDRFNLLLFSYAYLSTVTCNSLVCLFVTQQSCRCSLTF